MAKFTSNYDELGFYVNGQYRQFRGGVYVTDVNEEISVLERITDATRVGEAISEESAVKPAPKAPAPRKSSGK